MREIDFFTAVTYQDPKTFNESCIEAFDDYFWLSGRKVEVISKDTSNHHKKVHWVEKEPTLFLTALKIVSYFTLVIPFFMLIGKALLRFQEEFHLVVAKKITTNTSENGDKVNQVGTDILSDSDIEKEIDTLIKPQSSSPRLSKIIEEMSQNVECKAKKLLALVAKSNLNDDEILSQIRLKAKGYKESNQAYQEIAKTCLDQNPPILSIALTAAKEMSYGIEKSSILKQIATKYFEIEKYDQALEALEGASTDTKDPLIEEIAGKYYDARNYNEALKTLEMTYNYGIKDPLIEKIAGKHFDAGNYNEALKTLEMTYNSKIKDPLIEKIAGKHFDAGNYNEALKTLERTYNSGIKDPLIEKIAGKHFDAGNYNEALKTLERTYNSEIKDPLIEKIAGKYFDAGNYNEALNTLNRLSSKFPNKNEWSKKIAEAYRQGGNSLKADQILKEIENEEYSNKIITLLTKSEYDEALMLLGRSTLPFEEQKTWKELIASYRKTDEITQKLDAAPDWAFKEIQGVVKGYRKDQLLKEVIKKFCDLSRYEDIVSLLSQFDSDFQQKDGLESFAKLLKIDSCVSSDTTRKNIAKALQKRGDILLAQKVALDIKDTSVREELLGKAGSVDSFRNSTGLLRTTQLLYRHRN